jgi:PTS system mannose-specific IIB component
VALILTRIDCRLIHGQVIEAWVPWARANHLVVANDEAADDPLQRSIMTMAVPHNVRVDILSVAEAAQKLARGHWPDKRSILLFANCRDAYRSTESGLRFSTLNLGNLFCTPGKTQVTGNVSLDRDDIDFLKKIQALGVRVEVRPVPLASAVDMADLAGVCRAICSLD